MFQFTHIYILICLFLSCDSMCVLSWDWICWQENLGGNGRINSWGGAQMWELQQKDFCYVLNLSKFFFPYYHFLFRLVACLLVMLIFFFFLSFWIIPLNQVDQNQSSKLSFERISHLRIKLKQKFKLTCLVKLFFYALEFKQTSVIFQIHFWLFRGIKTFLSVFCTNKPGTSKSTGYDC